MSSARTPRAEDLTTRARIRDAAIGYFGAHGFRSATVRSIATAAGVSPALVIHHFGSKDGLRGACEAYVTERLDELSAEAAEHLAPADVLEMIARRPELAFLAPFLQTAMIEGGDFGHRLYSRLVDDLQLYAESAVAAGVMYPTEDERARAEMIVAFKLGVQLLAPYIAGPGSPPDQVLVDVSERLTIPALELFTRGIYTSTEYLDAFRNQRRADRNGSASTGLTTGAAGESGTR